MDGQRGDEVTYLRLMPEPHTVRRQPHPGRIARWLGLDRVRASRACQRQGHLPVRTPTGTDCQRCAEHWNHL